MNKSADLPSSTKKPAKNSRTTQEKQSDAPGAENLDKVREILFGMKMRDYENQISALEDTVHKEIATNTANIEKRIDSLESYFKKEINSLSDKIQSEHNQHEQAVKEIHQRFNEIDKRISSLEEKQDQASRQYHEEILEQSKTLRNEMREYQEEFRQSLFDSKNELNAKKVDCTYLASIFSEMAINLNNDTDGSIDSK